MAATTVGKLDLGRVFRDTFGVMRRRLAPLLILTLGVGFLPSFVLSALAQPMRAGTTPENPFAALSHPMMWIGLIASLFLSAYVMACQLLVAINDLEGQPASLSGVLRSGVGKILPVFAALILLWGGVTFGAMLLLVPGVILALMWAVALPAVVAESSNPIRAFGRSRALTRDNRWRILGLTLLAGLALLFVELIMVGLLGSTGTMSGASAASLPTLAAVSAITFVIYLLGTVGTAALYVQLRDLKGAGAASLAEVFA
jgi:hypothetical protein